MYHVSLDSKMENLCTFFYWGVFGGLREVERHLVECTKQCTLSLSNSSSAADSRTYCWRRFRANMPFQRQTLSTITSWVCCTWRNVGKKRASSQYIVLYIRQDVMSVSFFTFNQIQRVLSAKYQANYRIKLTCTKQGCHGTLPMNVDLPVVWILFK